MITDAIGFVRVLVDFLAAGALLGVLVVVIAEVRS